MGVEGREDGVVKCMLGRGRGEGGKKGGHGEV